MILRTIVNALFILMTLLTVSAHGFELKHLKAFQGAGAPKSVEISPDGSYAAVMNLEGMDFWLISTATLEFIKKVQFFRTPATGWDYETRIPTRSFAQKPVECAFSQNGRLLWISLHNAGAVTVYDTEDRLTVPDQVPYERVKVTDCITKETYEGKAIKIETGKTPKIIRVTPDGKYALVANWHSSSVSVVDAESFKTIKEIQLGGGKYIPRGIAISPDSTTAYVANMGGGTISVINLTDLAVVDDIPATINPRHIILSKDQKTLYISDNILGKIIRFDLIAKKITGEASIGKRARTIAISPDEKYLFGVAYDEGSLSVVEVDSFRLIYKKQFPFPMGLAVTPDGRQLWVTSYKLGMVSVYEIDDGIPRQ